MKDLGKYIDDDAIAPTCALLRRIHPDWIVDDENNGGKRISSQGFKDPTMSIHIGDDLAAAGHCVERVLDAYPRWDLAAVTTAMARSLKQAVCREHDVNELCHGIVAGKKSGSGAKALAVEATANWLVRRPR